MNKLTLIAYLLLILGFTALSFLYVDINLVGLASLYTGIAISQRNLVTGVYTIFILCFFIYYIFLLYQTRIKKLNLLNLRVIIIISSVLIFSYPAILSFDIFNYTSTAKVACFYKENPYIVMPIEFLNDPMLLYTRAANKLALYGPVWIISTCVPFFLGSANFLLTLFFFKTLPAICYFGICFLIYKLSGKGLFSLAFFALNPLILIETFVSGHNDSVMMFSALASFYFLYKRKAWIAVIIVIFSMLIKYATVFIIPVVLFIIYNQLRDRQINWERVWLWSGSLMFIVFLISPLREEMYPWYAIWFIPFIALLNKNRILQGGTIAFTLGLMLTYTPYMATGMYHGIVPAIRTLLSIIPLLIYVIFVSAIKLSKFKWD